MVPLFDGSPSRYCPNQQDDQRLSGQDSVVYLALATAIEAIEVNEDSIPNEAYRAMAPKVRQEIRRADAALKRAAFIVVAMAGESQDGL